MWLHFREERRKRSFPRPFRLVLFLSPPLPVCLHSPCNLQPCPTATHPYIRASLHFLEGQIVGSEIWLARFPRDIRPLSFTQPRAQRSVSAAGFRHQQLSFSRPVVCATCAHRHVALKKKRGMRESYSSGKFTSSGRDLERCLTKITASGVALHN